MTKEQINRIYIRTRLRYIMQDCLITDELVSEIRKMLMEIYETTKEENKQKGNEMVKTKK